MKTLLDKLMARQRRLMDTLEAQQAPPLAVAPVERPEPPDQAGEIAALNEAEGHLAEGNIAAAQALLLPFAQRATHVRTLTVLSRIASALGSFDDAVELLKRAERLDPSDPKVWRLLAEVCAICGLHGDEVRYRRQLSFVDPKSPAHTFVDLVRSIYRASPKGAKPSALEIATASKRLEAAADLTTEVQVRFAESLYAFGPQWFAEARRHYVAASPCGDDMRDVSARWRRVVKWCEDTGAPIERDSEAGLPGQRPFVASLSDAVISPAFHWTPIVDAGQIALSGFVVTRVKLRSEDPWTPLLMQTDKSLELRLPKHVPVVEHPALMLGGAPQYYHNTIECLSSLAIAERLGLGMDLPLVVNDDLAPFQLEQLALLGYTADRLIRVSADRPLQFAQLLVPSRPVMGGRWMDPLVPAWYRKRFVGERSPTRQRRLYLSRAAGLKRQVENEALLTAMLVAQGFEVVRPETLSVKEQVAMFADATTIVAPAGAALANMLFCPPGARVIVLHNSHVLGGGSELYFNALATACGHDFKAVACRPTGVVSGQRVIDANMVADVEAVRAAI
jgi:capsular polysaccharide biosynthesis protein